MIIYSYVYVENTTFLTDNHYTWNATFFRSNSMGRKMVMVDTNKV